MQQMVIDGVEAYLGRKKRSASWEDLGNHNVRFLSWAEYLGSDVEGELSEKEKGWLNDEEVPKTGLEFDLWRSERMRFLRHDEHYTFWRKIIHGIEDNASWISNDLALDECDDEPEYDDGYISDYDPQEEYYDQLMEEEEYDTGLQPVDEYYNQSDGQPGEEEFDAGNQPEDGYDDQFIEQPEEEEYDAGCIPEENCYDEDVEQPVEEFDAGNQPENDDYDEDVGQPDDEHDSGHELEEHDYGEDIEQSDEDYDTGAEPDDEEYDEFMEQPDEESDAGSKPEDDQSSKQPDVEYGNDGMCTCGSTIEHDI